MEDEALEWKSLKGFGPMRQKALEARGITAPEQLLDRLPTGYKDTTATTPICQLAEGMQCAFEGRIDGPAHLHRAHGMTWVSARVRDDSGAIRCLWFNQPWMKQQLREGESALFFARIVRRKTGLYAINPSLETERRITPVYAQIPGVPQKLIRDATSSMLDACECRETLPETLLRRHQLCGRAQALRQAHFPQDVQALSQAKRRLAFEELLLFQAAVSGAALERPLGTRIPCAGEDAAAFWQAQPYAPTGAQQRVLQEIFADLAAPTAMARMVQGDVGCGKTAIAFAALFAAARHGFQGALMAPTEVLAVQHMRSAEALLAPLGVRCGLLTGKLSAAGRREAHTAIAEGRWDVVIGTHALISEGVQYARLGLVVTDEQHRFGVRQRTQLSLKGESPNVLVMSATPIPRTLALVLYGDLDISVVDELPPGRREVRTRVVGEEKREALYAFIEKEVRSGAQAYVVCPLVEDSLPEDECVSATQRYEELRAGPLRTLRLGLVHGRMRSAAKEETLRAFEAGELDVLVATTVVEVGVNVPNASVMVVENAERFGLAQLHQLRGRVGRGERESWCFLMAQPNERLRTLVETSDGFAVAKRDLEIRGAGEFFGTRQHGEPRMPALMLCADAALLRETQDAWREIRENPDFRGEAEVIVRAARRKFEKDGLNLAKN